MLDDHRFPFELFAGFWHVLMLLVVAFSAVRPLSAEERQAPPATEAQKLNADKASDACGPQEVQIPPELRDIQTTVSVNADSQEKDGDIWHLRGHVVVTYQDRKLTADEATYHEVTKDIVAKGHVTMTDSAGHLEGDEAHYNVESGAGWITNTHGYLKAKIRPHRRALVTENPLFVRAARVERVDADTYKVKAARLSSCTSEATGWTVGARSGRVELGDKLVVHQADLRFLKVPVFYAPVLVHSIAPVPRQTGLLIPNLGHSSQKGYIFGEGLFWAINPSADLLMGADYYSKRGWGGTARFRARPSATSQINIDYFGVNDKLGSPGQDVKASGQAQNLFGGFRGVLDVDYLSSLAFRQTFTDSFSLAVASEVRQTGFLTKNFGPYSANIYVSRYQNFLCAAQTLNQNPNCPSGAKPGDSVSIRQSPSFYLSGMDNPVGQSPFYFSFEGSAAGVSRSEPDFSTPRLSDRLDFHPQLMMRSKPFRGFYLTPSVGLRATHFGTSLTPGRDPLNRLLGELSFDLRPPALEKILSQTYRGHRVKHVIAPEVRYHLVRAFNDDHLDNVVRFDSVDIFSQTNEFEYSLTNSLFIRRDKPGTNGEEPQARELISWRLSQKYYFDPTFGGALEPGKEVVFDPTISVTGFPFAQGRRLSPIVSVVKFSPFSNYDTELTANINPSHGGVQNVGLTSYVHRGPLGLAMTEFFINRTSLITTSSSGTTTRIIPEVTGVGGSSSSPQLVSFNLLRAVATYGDTNRKGVSAAFGLDYNLDQRIAHQIVSQVSYNFGCFGLDFEYRRFNLGNLRNENQYRIALSLANIGTFGNLKPRERLY